MYNFNAVRLLVIFVFFIQSCHINKPINNQTQTKQTLRLGVNNWFFWHKYEDGKFSGPEVDIWREIATRNNLEIECKSIINLKQMKVSMENDSIDVFIGLLRNEEREKYMYFIEPPFRTKLKFSTYIKASSDILIDKYEDLYKYKIAMTTNTGDYPKIANDSNITRILCGGNPAEAFNLLLEDKVDAVHMDEWQAIWCLQSNKYKDQIELAQYAYTEYHPAYIVMAKKSSFAKKWKDDFGQTIQQMIDDGTMKNIIDSYVPGWYEVYTPE